MKAGEEGHGKPPGVWVCELPAPPQSLLCSGSVTGKPEEGELELPT